MNKRLVALLLALMFVMSALAGCKGNDVQETTAGGDETTTVAGTEGTQGTEEESTGAVEKVMEFEYFAKLSNPYPESSPVYDLLMQNTGVTINFNWAASDAAQTLLSSRISEKDLPDVIGNWGYDAFIQTLIDDGLIVSLTDILEEKMPNYYKLLTEDDIAFSSNVNDGELYGFGYVHSVQGLENWIIREDWLKKLNLEMPTTWDQLVNVWKAFRDGDPNGNNQKDEIAFVFNGSNTGASGNDSLRAIKNIFGIASNGIYSVYDGEYYYDPEHPRYMEYLDAMHMLHEEGLIPSNYVTMSSDERKSIFGNDCLGSQYASASTAAQNNKNLVANVPDVMYVCMSPVKGPHGDQMIAERQKMNNKTWITTAAIENGTLDTILEFFNYVFSDEGTFITNYGIENESYKMVDGKPVLQSPYVDKFANARSYGIVPQTFPFYMQAETFLAITYAGQSEDDMDAFTYTGVEGLKVVNEGYYYSKPQMILTDAAAEYADLLTEQTAIEDKYILGLITRDEYLKQYDALKKAGLQEVIDQAKAAYANMIAK